MIRYSEATWSVWSFGWLTFRRGNQKETQIFIGPFRFIMARKDDESEASPYTIYGPPTKEEENAMEKSE